MKSVASMKRSTSFEAILSTLPVEADRTPAVDLSRSAFAYIAAITEILYSMPLRHVMKKTW